MSIWTIDMRPCQHCGEIADWCDVLCCYCGRPLRQGQPKQRKTYRSVSNVRNCGGNPEKLLPVLIKRNIESASLKGWMDWYERKRSRKRPGKEAGD